MRCTTLSLALTLLALVQCQGPPNPIGYDDPPSPISDDGSGIVMTPSDLGSSGFLDMTDPSNGNFLGNSPPVPRTCPAQRLQGAKDDPRLVNDPACPTDNGDIFITSDGAHFAFQCCAHHPDEGRDKIPDAETNQPSMRDCAELCTQTSGCQSVIFTEVVHGTDVVGTCKLFRTGGYSAAACGGDMHDYAYMTSPPAIDIPEPLTILCSTECPHANGQQYSAKYGEAFTMYCGKRHGTKVIHQDSRETFQDCMDACSRLLPCHSVDYHASSKICYYGTQHSEPQVAASGFASARSVGCAGACSGGGACCQQGTLLEVDDIAKPLPPPARCGNQGIQWAQFTNNQGYNNDGSYGQFRPEIFKGQAPGASGVTSTIGGIDAMGGQQISVYGSSQRFSGDFFTLHHKGYLYASVEGEYKFTVSKVDDALFLWLGDPAIKGWTRSNANLVVGVHGTGSEVVRLARGEYMAFRVVLAQAQDGARFAMEIEGPDGQIIADSQTTSSPWILQYSCDGTSAPEFLTWGAEY